MTLRNKATHKLDAGSQFKFDHRSWNIINGNERKRESLQLRAAMTPRGIQTSTWLWISCLLLVSQVELRPQGFPYYQLTQQEDYSRAVRDAPNLVRKDFYIHEIPEEVIEDEIQYEMQLMQKRRQREQFELDRYVLKLYEEFRRRERDGTLSSYRLF